MPKLVDHASRRAEIIDAMLRIVARDGLAGATMRALATELGVANGAVGHYFANQDALLAATYEEVFARSNTRAAGRAQGQRGIDALLAVLHDLLPLAPDTIDEARIVVCFWGRASTDARLLARLPEAHRGWVAHVRELLTEAVEGGELRADAAVDDLADLIVTTVHAMQVRAVTLPDDTPPATQRRLIEQILKPWLVTRRALADRWPPAA